MTKSKKKKREEAKKRNKRKGVEVQQTQPEVRFKEIPAIPREHSQNGKKNENDMNMLYRRCLKSIILERECPACERALTADRQGGFSCTAGHIVGWKIGDIHRKVDDFSIKGS